MKQKIKSLSAIVFSLALVGAANAADLKCNQVSGTFHLVPDPQGCQVATAFPNSTFVPGQCYVGSFTGSFTGTSVNGLTSVTPTSLGLLVTGKSAMTITGPDGQALGQLYTSDAGIIEPDGSSAEKNVITGGTGTFTGAQGVLFTTGAVLTPTGGQYNGYVCLPKKNK